MAAVMPLSEAGEPTLPGRGALDLRALADPATRAELERRLAELAHSRGPARVVLAELAHCLLARDALQSLNFTRVADYADELGMTARTLHDLARVGRALRERPGLRAALESGRLGWTKVRLLAGVTTPDDEERWIERARGATAAALAKEVREVDRGSLEGGELDEQPRSHLLQIPCTPEVYFQWRWALKLAERVSGGRLSLQGCGELIAAEAFSGITLDEESARALEAVQPDPVEEPEDSSPVLPACEDRPVAPPPELVQLLEGLEDADPFELDRRLRAAVAWEQRLESRMGPLLEAVYRSKTHEALGFETREAYARERLGLDPAQARALLAVERAACQSPALDVAYRSGRVTPLQARTLAPVLTAQGGERFGAAWVEWAGRTTLRRLRDDVDHAVEVLHTEPERWQRDGGLPPEAQPDREIGAQSIAPREREIGAHENPPEEEESCEVSFIGQPETVALMKALLCSVRRRFERVLGRLATPGEALGAVLHHVIESWEPERRSRDPIHERDGWRCAVPACTSRRNLHVHHIVFRSHSGGSEPENLVSLCAFHHWRAVHGRMMRVVGEAPDRLRFELGWRPGKPPHAVYTSGDVRQTAAPV